MIEKFDPLVQKWKIDRGVRTFSTWEMTQALLSCFVMRLGSFREVEAALKIPDSTFGDALRDRHFGFFKNSAILFSSRFAVEQKVENSKKQFVKFWPSTLPKFESTEVFLANRDGNRSIPSVTKQRQNSRRLECRRRMD
ncbi:MAG: DUF4372 domain-containing protein [Bdellovibrionales bacterium]|nr:DUF4372 domain-containing protein [Bdellovibrionales bacterium]